MTVTASSSDYTGPYAPDGVATAFPFSFKAMSAEELRVLRLASDGTEAVLSGYSVTLTDAGGTVTFSSPPSVGDPLYIVSDPSFNQELRFGNQSSWSPSSLDEGLDRAAVRDIALASAIARAPLAPPTEQIANLPGAADRAGKFFVFDAQGDPALSSGSGTDTALRTDLTGATGANLIATSTGDTVESVLSGLRHGTGPIVLLIAGQSNALGNGTGGLNPASAKVKTWDAVLGTWGGSNYNSVPWTRAAPDGNGGKNNIGLAMAHSIAEITNRKVYVILHAKSGTSLQDDWLAGQNLYGSMKTKVQAALASSELSGKATIDAMIWAQGEEDDSRGYTFATHMTKLGTLDTTLRAETWVDDYTPIYVTGMSDLHERYEVNGALKTFPLTVPGWFYIDTRGLPTSDNTHWTGPALWHIGHDVIGPRFCSGEVRSDFYPYNAFYGRADGRLTQSDAVAIPTFGSMVSWRSRTDGPSVTDTFTGDGSTVAFKLTSRGTISTASGIPGVTVNGVTKVLTTDYTVAQTGNDRPVLTFLTAPPNTEAIVITYSLAISGPAGSDSISWGYRCNASGDYSLAGGYLSYVPAAYKYAIAWGRGCIAGNDGDAIFGMFPKYIDGSRRMQFGIGTSDSVRKNAVGVALAGNVEILAPIGGTDPGQNEEITFRLTSTTNLRIAAKCSDGVVRVANVTVA